jgi:hypothetical protein
MWYGRGLRAPGVWRWRALAGKEEDLSMIKRDEERTTRDHAVIQDAWAVIAALAWDGYEEHGRGAVVVKWADGAPELRYADAATLAVEHVVAHVPDLLDHLASSDAAVEVLIMVQRAEGIRGYRLRAGELTPPAASALARHIRRPPVA